MKFKNGACPPIYGPVTSRRHGRSLGINLGSPDTKVCTWGCLYCQCGNGEIRNLQSSDPVPSREYLLSLLKESLATCGPIDTVTFAGNSEPADHPDFLAIIRDIKRLRHAMRGKWILNCLSNGSELERTDVIQACNALDEAWIKLDCADEAQYVRLNRAVARVGSVKDHLNRIMKLNEIRIQTLLWDCPTHPLASNWNPTNLRALSEAYLTLQPKMIHLTSVSREPAARRLTPVPAVELERFAHELCTHGLKVEVFP